MFSPEENVENLDDLENFEDFIFDCKEYLRQHLSKKRYTHCLNVAGSAVDLAVRYDASPDKAYAAGLLHDIAKEEDKGFQFELVLRSQRDVDDVEKKTTPLFHAIAGAELVREIFGICDEDVLNAVRYHTVARAGMSKLEQIVYIADLISADRDFKDVSKFRKLAKSSLESAMYESLKFSIESAVNKGNLIPASTLAAYNEFTQNVKKKG